MLTRLLIRWAVLTVAIGVVAVVLPGVHIIGGLGALLWVAALFGLINAVLGPLLKLLSLPLILLTLGLFLLVVNAALLGITAWLSDHLDIDGFWWAVLGGLLISVISWALDALLPDDKRRRPRRRQVTAADGWQTPHA